MQLKTQTKMKTTMAPVEAGLTLHQGAPGLRFLQGTICTSKISCYNQASVMGGLHLTVGQTRFSFTVRTINGFLMAH